MNTKKKIINIIISASMFIVPLNMFITSYSYDNVASAKEENYKLSDKDINKINEDIGNYVSKENIQHLINKLNNNENTEVTKENEVPIIEKNIKLNDIEYKNIKIYKDYSYSITGISKLPTISFRSLDNISCGSGYCWGTNAHAYKYVNGGEIGLYASLEYTNKYGRISSAWSPYAKQDGVNIKAQPISMYHQAGYSYASTSASIHNQYYTVTLKVGPYGASVY